MGSSPSGDAIGFDLRSNPSQAGLSWYRGATFVIARDFPMWIKICGIRDVASAEAVIAATPDAIGLNFHPPSPRFVSLEEAARIRELLPAAIESVGVFVDATPAEMLATCSRCDLDAVQLHGDESPSVLAELKQRRPELRLLRAFRFGTGGLTPLRADLDECRRLGAEPDACLIDAHVSGAYGGTGTPVPWNELAEVWQADALPPLVLAGGLNPANVAEAIRIVDPAGVDVAGGVESAPGMKDARLATRFVAAAREARSTRG